MRALTEMELDNLSVMYEGDKNRDASSKVRGYLFQEYVSIMCLLQNQVEYVCLECLEDVDVIYTDGTFEFIQVKYYPKANPDMKEILTDLYYQFLRLEMLHSTFSSRPRLYIHSKSTIPNTTIDNMKTYINLPTPMPNSVIYPCTEDSVNYLKSQVYTLNKEEQKRVLFSKMSSEESLKRFVNEFQIATQSNVELYKRDLMASLSRAFPNPNGDENDDHWRLILLGLAIIFVQQRFTINVSCFTQILFDKMDFDKYMTESIMKKTEKTIESYLVGLVCERFGEIIDHNSLSELQNDMLNRIYHKTVEWISEISKTVDGQYQIINTVSTDEISDVISFKDASIEKRMLMIAECKPHFLVFLGYLWKIMLNICQDTHDCDKTKIQDDLFDPKYYIDSKVHSYICFDFPDDKYVRNSVILPRAGSGDFNGAKRRIIDRMVKMSPKPGKWFFENSKLIRGKNFYSYSTANVIEDPSIVDLGQDVFYIECMDCIGIDEDEWDKHESCNNCIFIEKCIRGGE